MENQNRVKKYTHIKLLYVEDDQITRENMLDILYELFSDIVVAKDGQEGVEKFQENQDIDLIITDIRMPKLDGIQMLEQIKDINESVLVLVFSAHNETEYFLDSIKVGVDGYLLKPLDINTFTQSLEKCVTKINLKKELDEYKHTLEKKVQEQVSKLAEQENMIQKHAKLAAMGEMIDIIAHQWKQPLNTISVKSDFLVAIHEDQEHIPFQNVKACNEKVIEQINYLTNTLDEFRSFFRPNRKIEKVKLRDIIHSLDILLKDNLIKHNIVLQKEFDEELILSGNPNELKHIFINLINNARDAFEQNNIKNRIITISSYKDEQKASIIIKDNAGGIPQNLLPYVFDPHFTTKEAIGGTGIGLYMCNMIATKYHMSIDVQVVDDSTEFVLNMIL